ncbi:uncharacterized protein METZ01_LOCUS362175, partial [marine metagenome]
VRFLIIGSGNIALRHISNLKELCPQSEIAVLTSKTRFSDAKKEKLNLVKNIFFTQEDALSFNPQAVFICNPASLHIQSAKFFAEKGVNLFIEKPLSDNLDEVDRLIKIIQQKQITSMVGYPLRFNKSMKYFKDALMEERIGKIIFVRSRSSSYLPDWRPDTDYRDSVSAQKKLGGGVLLEVSHEVDYLHWIFGESRIYSSYIGKLSDLEVDTEDYAFLLMGFAEKESNSF